MAEPAPRWSRADDFYAARGLDVPEPLSDVEHAELERRQDEADRDVERIHGLRNTSAA